MGKQLNADLVLSKAKTDNLHMIKKINLWGQDISDVKLLRQMPNVEILSLSVNKIASLKEFSYCPKLQELYLRKNEVSDLSEIRYLTSLQNLRILWLWDNPCSENVHYREYIIKMLPNLVKLDNDPITPEERVAAAKLNINLSDYQIQPKDDLPQSPVKNTPEYEENQTAYNKYENKYYSSQSKNKQLDEQKAQYESQGHQSHIQKKDSYYVSSSPQVNRHSVKNENIMSAIMILMKDLDDQELGVLRKEIDKRLSPY